jgi:branched-chain amino acid transport system permease protein
MSNVINGLMVGGLYAAVALGLTLVFGVMRLVNLAHGEMLVAGAFLSYVVVTELDVDPLLSLIAVVPVVMLAAYPVQRYLLNPLLSHGMEPPLVATFGISIIAQTGFLLIFGADPKSLEASYATSGVDILGERVRSVLLISLIAGVLLVAGLHLALTRLRYGKALRAAAIDPEAASTLGIDVKHLYALTFAIAAGLAAVGGVLIATAFTVTPTTGLSWILRAFTVIVLGGMGSVPGTLAGGLLLGVSEEVGSDAFGAEYRDLMVFALLIAFLVARPQGLFGRTVAPA